MANRFRILLNRISGRLNEHEIRSLVHLCDVPEGLRAGLKDGISLFDNLIKRDVINEHKLGKLKLVLKNLSPKRRDLVREIENFENGIPTGDNASSTLNSDVSSTLNSDVSLPFTITPVSRSDMKETRKKETRKETCCTIDCPCMVMSCYKYGGKIRWSYVVLSTFFLVCFLIVALLWYADVPKVNEAITSDEHVKKAGPFVLLAIVVLFLACLFLMCYVKKRRDRQSKKNATAAGNQNGMQEVRARKLAINLRETRAGTSKIENKKKSNFGFSRYIDDFGAEDLDTDQDAVSRGSN